MEGTRRPFTSGRFELAADLSRGTSPAHRHARSPRSDARYGVGLLVLVALSVLVAGCIGSGAPPSRPATLTPKPLPERPANLSAMEAVEFAERYEAAYGFNEELAENTTRLTINPVRAYLLGETETGYVVHLEVGLSTSVVHYDPERREWIDSTGDGFYTANYFVNETTVRRAAAGGQRRPGPDPRNGTVLEG